MFRIKPVRNQTNAKYTYHNVNQTTVKQSNTNGNVNLGSIKPPTNKFINTQKITQPSKHSLNPFNNKPTPKINFIRSQKPHDKPLLKRVNNNQHKLKLSNPNHIPSKKVQSIQHYNMKISQKMSQVPQNPQKRDNKIKTQNKNSTQNQDIGISISKQSQTLTKKQIIQEPIVTKIQQSNQKLNKQKDSQEKFNEKSSQNIDKNIQPQISFKKQVQEKYHEPEKQKSLAQQKQNERQKEMQNLVQKIQKRRQARQKQKLKLQQMESKRKQNEERALQFMNQRNNNNQNNQEITGLLQLNDQLMHFSLAESIMDLQIKKLLKTNFSDFPNYSQIKYQIQELQRINMSYEMVRMDENNPLRNGLKNYRIEIFNRIGEEIIKAQAQGYSNPNFHIMEHDGRISQPENSFIPQATRGLPKQNQDSFIKYVENQQNQECTICLGEIKMMQKVAKLQCGHSFHINCIKEWVQSSANCPTCRFNIKFGSKKL